MSHDSIPVAEVPTHRLRGEDATAYVRGLIRILRAARLNAHFPDARAMSSHLHVLSPEIHRGLYDGLDVDVRSGLPTYREWTRAQTDVRLAPDQLRQLGERRVLERKARESPESIYPKQLRKFDYYSSIRNKDLAPLGDMQIALRRVDSATSTAHFHVVLDKLDASGLFVRYSIDLSQRAESWAEKVAHVDEHEVARHTEEFEGLIYKFTSLDAQFAFARLATMPGLELERVVKGVIGPIFFPWSRFPESVSELVGDDGVLATFSLDMAAFDVAEDRNNDPLNDIIATRMDLSEKGKAVYEKGRERFGYRVFKDRKFVCPRDRVADVRAWCTARGTKNIVYGT